MLYYVMSFFSLMCQMYTTFLYCQGKKKNNRGWIVCHTDICYFWVSVSYHRMFNKFKPTDAYVARSHG